LWAKKTYSNSINIFTSFNYFIELRQVSFGPEAGCSEGQGVGHTPSTPVKNMYRGCVIAIEMSPDYRTNIVRYSHHLKTGLICVRLSNGWYFQSGFNTVRC
jgi:hypothetical protein